MDTATTTERPVPPPPVLEHADWYRRLRRLARAHPPAAPGPVVPRESPAADRDPSAALARHAARLAAEIDRADAAREQQEADARAEEAIRLGEKLLEMDDAPRPRGKRAEPPEPPAVLHRRLLASAEGCQWLLDRWLEFAALLELGIPWGPADLRRLVRLLGKRPLEAAYDPELNGLLVAFDGPWPGTAEAFFDCCRARLGTDDPALRDLQDWRPMFETPDGMAGCRESVLAVMERHMARLRALRDEHAGRTVPISPTLPDTKQQVLERLQLARSRELCQAVAQLSKPPAAVPVRRADRRRPGIARPVAGTRHRPSRSREPTPAAVPR